MYNYHMNLEEIKKLKIPKSSGVYKFKDRSGKIIYIGKAADLKMRVFSYWGKSANHTPAKYSMLKKIKKVEWTETESEIEALLLEANLIKKYQPRYNVVMRDDKRFVYIKVSAENEIPGVFMTRKVDKSGKYFGPFVSAEAARETLKAIRKIWPYCTERKRKKKPCFYYQINRCVGICAGLVSRKEYREKVIKPIILFLEGKKDKIIKSLELRIKKYNANLRMCANTANVDMRNEIEEKINLIKYQLLNMKKVLAHANVLSVGEKYANDVVELTKILNLLKTPERIEGYDISNIFGKETVGSMVVFSGGEPDKNEYRKFKIRIGPSSAKATEDKQGDVQMLKEIIKRRFKHTSPSASLLIRRGEKGESWPLPDLIIIDGGKAQLNVALSILRRNKLDILAIAISKGKGLRSALAPDKIFFPGEKKPLELPLASPAMHLLKRVRDEAHRFAISYHRKLRKRKFL